MKISLTEKQLSNQHKILHYIQLITFLLTNMGLKEPYHMIEFKKM